MSDDPTTENTPVGQTPPPASPPTPPATPVGSQSQAGQSAPKPPPAAPIPVSEPMKPEVAVGLAFAGGLVVARILRRLGR